jgi:hypothetical protein
MKPLLSPGVGSDMRIVGGTGGKRHASGTNSRKMRNHDALINDDIVTSFSGMTSMLRLPKS